MIIIVGASVSDVEMVIIIRKFHKCAVCGAFVHVARRQVTLGAHSWCDSHVGSSTGTKSNRSLGVQEFTLRGGPCPALASCADALLYHLQRETAVEMLEEVHKGLRPINALKLAIDRRILGVAIF